MQYTNNACADASERTAHVKLQLETSAADASFRAELQALCSAMRAGGIRGLDDAVRTKVARGRRVLGLRGHELSAHLQTLSMLLRRQPKDAFSQWCVIHATDDEPPARPMQPRRRASTRRGSSSTDTSRGTRGVVVSTVLPAARGARLAQLETASLLEWAGFRHSIDASIPLFGMNPAVVAPSLYLVRVTPGGGAACQWHRGASMARGGVVEYAINSHTALAWGSRDGRLSEPLHTFNGSEDARGILVYPAPATSAATHGEVDRHGSRHRTGSGAPHRISRAAAAQGDSAARPSALWVTYSAVSINSTALRGTLEGGDPNKPDSSCSAQRRRQNQAAAATVVEMRMRRFAWPSLQPLGEPVSLRRMGPGGIPMPRHRAEKNWVPLGVANAASAELLLSYELEPHVVLRCSSTSGDCATEHISSAAPLWRRRLPPTLRPSGGTPCLRPAAHTGSSVTRATQLLLCLGHAHYAARAKSRVYVHFFYALRASPPFDVLKVSRPFRFPRLGASPFDGGGATSRARGGGRATARQMAPEASGDRIQFATGMIIAPAEPREAQAAAGAGTATALDDGWAAPLLALWRRIAGGGGAGSAQGDGGDPTLLVSLGIADCYAAEQRLRLAEVLRMLDDTSLARGLLPAACNATTCGLPF